jgi:S-(hydroxymethyl)glutathione dehydrogenase/alcohol dehydrogenase
VPGHEAAGVVEAVGPDVTEFRPGDHVIGCLSIFCGRCEYCLSGRPVLCTRQGLERGPGEPPRLSRNGEPLHQFLRLSAFAERMLVHENALVKIRHEMPLDRAALIGCAVTTGLGAVFNTARVPPGATVAVIGCGGVGLNCVQGAAIAGASRVVAIDTLPWKLELARAFGATDGIDATAGDPVGQVRELTGGGVEYSFEAIGLKATAEQAFAMLRSGGTATIIGMIPEGERIELPGSDFLDEKKIQGSNMGSNRFRIDMPRYVDLYLGGRFEARRAGLGPDRPGRDQRRVRGDAPGRGGPQRDRLRRRVAGPPGHEPRAWFARRGANPLRANNEPSRLSGPRSGSGAGRAAGHGRGCSRRGCANHWRISCSAVPTGDGDRRPPQR